MLLLLQIAAVLDQELQAQSTFTTSKSKLQIHLKKIFFRLIKKAIMWIAQVHRSSKQDAFSHCADSSTHIVQQAVLFYD